MEPGGYRHRTPQALTGVIGAAFMVGCSRWGAHLRIGPFYAGDLLIALAVGHALVSRPLAGPRPATGTAKRSHPGLAVVLLLGWAICRFAAGSDHGLNALRDFAPYGYALVAYLSARSFALSTAADRRRTLRVLEVALVGHLLWVIPALLVYGVDATTAGAQTFGLLLVRGDVDGTVLGITACLFLLRYLRGGGLWRLLVAGGSLGVTLAMTARSAVLATFVGLALGLWLYLIGDHHVARRNPQRRLAVAAAVPFLLAAFVFALPHTTAGSKLLTSMGLKQATSKVDQGGLGTKRARTNAWQLVRDYTEETRSRRLAGVGFGPNFMIDSGASVALVSSNDPDLRSPHNYLVGSYARVGLVGVSLIGLVALSTLAGIWRVRRVAASDDLVFLAVIAPPMILVEAVVGVVLEAPFGAIPFFWFLGILLAKPLQSQPETPAAEEPEQILVAVT